MSVRKTLLIIIPVFLLIATAGFWYLGGFNEPEVSEVVVVGGYTLVGKEYVGTLKHPALNELLDEVSKRWEAGEFPGVLTVAVLKEPKTDKDTVEQFIGVLLPAGERPDQLPEGYEVMQLPATKAVRITLEAHSSVWPSPDKLRNKVEAFAREKGYQLQPGILFEKYHGPRKLEVEVPLSQTTARH